MNAPHQSIYPGLSYDDAPAAIDFLERAFGFARETVYADGDVVHHAQVRARDELIMLGTSREDGTGRTSPRRTASATLSLYLAVPDADALHARAKAAGARIVREPYDPGYDDSRNFIAADPEGYVWGFGTYAAAPRAHLNVCLRYEDATAAIERLEHALGFARKMVVAGEAPGEIAHAELLFGADVLMLASDRRDDLAFASPRKIGATTGGVYIASDDVDGLYARAKAAGCEIVRELETTDYGSREFGIRDAEGQRFSFGTYRP